MLAHYLSPLALVRRCAAAHHVESAVEENGREQMLADHRDSAARVRRPGLAGACAEGLSFVALDADVVGVAFGLVGDFVQARLVAADVHVLAGQSLGCFRELFGALNLNHCNFPFRLNLVNRQDSL